jgi:hypothetical protein
VCGPSADLDFCQHLFDTIILLGGKNQIADFVKKSMDWAVSDADIDALRIYNAELMTQAKDRLANINTFKIRTRPER